MDKPEDQDEIVEQCGTLLMSEDVKTVADGFYALQAVALDAQRQGSRGLGRVLQELAAYKGGAVIERVLRGAKRNSDSNCELDNSGTDAGPQKFIDGVKIGNEPVFDFIMCSWALGLLSRSTVVVERCLAAGAMGEEQTAKELYRSLTGNALKGARQLAYGPWAEPLPKWEEAIAVFGEQMIVAALESAMSFLRYSRVFRDSMRDALEESSLFEDLGFFLAEDFLAMISADWDDRIRRVMADLAVSLAMSTDSQLWALDKGLLKLVAAIYEATTERQLRKDAKRGKLSPLFRCNLVLFNLLQTPAMLEKMRAHNVLAGFRPHKPKMNEADRSTNVWRNFEKRLQGVPGKWEITQECREFPPAEILCSWKLCSAGQELKGEKSYGKCALCQVARYCR